MGAGRCWASAPVGGCGLDRDLRGEHAAFIARRPEFLTGPGAMFLGGNLVPVARCQQGSAAVQTPLR
jgi:hypothetical protein